MSIDDTTEEFDVTDFPDACPICGDDLTIDRRTDVEILHTARKAFGFEEHMSENHRVIWWVAGKITWVRRKLRQRKS